VLQQESKEESKEERVQSVCAMKGVALAMTSAAARWCRVCMSFLHVNREAYLLDDALPGLDAELIGVYPRRGLLWKLLCGSLHPPQQTLQTAAS